MACFREQCACALSRVLYVCAQKNRFIACAEKISEVQSKREVDMRLRNERRHLRTDIGEVIRCDSRRHRRIVSQRWIEWTACFARLRHFAEEIFRLGLPCAGSELEHTAGTRSGCAPGSFAAVFRQCDFPENAGRQLVDLLELAEKLRVTRIRERRRRKCDKSHRAKANSEHMLQTHGFSISLLFQLDRVENEEDEFDDDPCKDSVRD